MSEGESTASRASTDDKTAPIQYKPVTSLAGSNTTLAHYEQSCGYDQISHAYPIFMAYMSTALMSLTSYSYVYSWNPDSYQIVSSTNGLG